MDSTSGFSKVASGSKMRRKAVTVARLASDIWLDGGLLADSMLPIRTQPRLPPQAPCVSLGLLRAREIAPSSRMGFHAWGPFETGARRLGPDCSQIAG